MYKASNNGRASRLGVCAGNGFLNDNHCCTVFQAIANVGCCYDQSKCDADLAALYLFHCIKNVDGIYS